MGVRENVTVFECDGLLDRTAACPSSTTLELPQGAAYRVPEKWFLVVDGSVPAHTERHNVFCSPACLAGWVHDRPASRVRDSASV